MTLKLLSALFLTMIMIMMMIRRRRSNIRRQSSVTIVVNHDHVATERWHFVECLITAAVVTVVDQLTVNTERLPMLLPLVTNEMVLTKERFVTVLVLTQKILDIKLLSSPAVYYWLDCSLTPTARLIPLQNKTDFTVFKVKCDNK